MTGLEHHPSRTLGASGAIEWIAVVEALRRGRMYPTRNLEAVAEECKGVRHVVAPEPTAARTFVKNSFAFGGVNASLVCRVG